MLAAEDNAVNQLVLKTLLHQLGVEPVVVDRATGRPLGEIRIRLVMPDER